MGLIKRFAIVIYMSLIVICVRAENISSSIESFFVAMPDEEIEYLNMSLKSEMVELYKFNSPLKVKNLMGGESWISYMDSTRVDVVLSSNKVFMTIYSYEKKRGEKIYAVVKTLYTPVADSDVHFYNDMVERVDADRLFVFPAFKDFFAKTNKKELTKVLDMISMVFYKIDVLKGGDFSISLDDMWLDVLDANISGVLKQTKSPQPLNYIWDGKRFKVEKE